MEVTQIVNPRVKQIQAWMLDAPEVVYHDIFGFDPGTTHLGIAHHFGHIIDLFQVTLERSKDPLERMDDIGFLLSFLCERDFHSRYRRQVVIEYAGFEASQYRQVELAECRTTIALWFKTRGVSSILFPAPNTLRKAVFGSGKIKAHQYWTSEIPPDALAALSCVYYANKLEDQKDG